MDFHFHVFLECMYVHVAVRETDRHEGEMARQSNRDNKAEHTLHMTEWYLDKSGLCMITSDLIQMKRLMLCILNSGRAGVRAIPQISFRLTIPWDFFQGEDNLEGHTASSNQMAI